MQANTVGRSVTNQARRHQIVDATVALVADQGYRACTFQGIAQRAGLSSTRTISYHFADKDDLIAATLASLFTTIGDFVAKQTVDHPDARAALAGYIRAAVALNDTHRDEMRALLRIFLDHRPAGGSRPYTDSEETSALGRVEAILLEGQQAGLFCDFDPRATRPSARAMPAGAPAAGRPPPTVAPVRRTGACCAPRRTPATRGRRRG